MTFRSLGALWAGVVVFSASCAFRRETVLPWDGCSRVAGETTFAMRRSQPADPASRVARTGAMVFLVAGNDPLEPAVSARVELLVDTLALARTRAIRAGDADSRGYLRWDSLPVGRYGLFVGRIGYDLIRRPVEVRAGAIDTFDVTLRWRQICMH